MADHALPDLTACLSSSSELVNIAARLNWLRGYLADRDPIGLTKEDDEAVRKRRERLAPKLGQD